MTTPSTGNKRNPAAPVRKSGALAALLLLAGVGVASIPDSGFYRDRIVPPLPEGHEQLISYLVLPNARRVDVAYSVSIVAVGPRIVVWLAANVGERIEDPVWKIRTAFPLPEIPEGFIVTGGNCSVGGQPRTELIAVVRFDAAAENLTDVYAAWWTDIDGETFSSYTTEDISCVNEAWDLP